MNLFFFVYQDLEFQNYFPIALEIKNKYKNSKITFIFTEKEKYEEIIKSNFVNLNLKKNFNFFVYKKSKNKFIQKIMTLFNITNVIIKFTKNKKPILFFAKFSILNQKILAKIAKFFSGKIIYLAPERVVHPGYLYSKKRWKFMLSFNREYISNFNFFVFYHKENFFYRYVNKIIKEKSKIIFIGLPNMFFAWKNLVTMQAKKKIKELKKKFGTFSNIYTIIGGKDGDSKFLRNRNSQYYSILNIIETIKSGDPGSLIIFKPHPRALYPNYLKKALKKISFKKFEVSLEYTDVLALISKRFFFISPTGALTHVQNVKKIDVSDYKNLVHKKYYNDYPNTHYNASTKGYGVRYFDLRKKYKKKILFKYFTSDSVFKKNEISIKEQSLIKKNKPIIQKLITIINKS